MNMIYKLKNKTSNGIDVISNQLVKLTIIVLVKPNTTIINQMIGIFPENLKISRVIFLYKAKVPDPLVEL